MLVTVGGVKSVWGVLYVSVPIHKDVSVSDVVLRLADVGRCVASNYFQYTRGGIVL